MFLNLKEDMVNIAFLHPDLGIGGAERLVVDAAVALKSKGHGVHCVTAHHDSSHCFKETTNGCLTVTTAGDWLPRSLFGILHALFAYLRMIYAALYLVLCKPCEFDIIFADQISACIPLLKLLTNAKVIFYCHFPDQLLTKRQSYIKKLYRIPLDWLEEVSTGLADRVLVNSKFTAGIFKDTFTSLTRVEPLVLYPSIITSTFDATSENKDEVPILSTKREYVFLSINRYERKKNIGIAIKALGKLKNALTQSEWKKVHLFVAGGYDERVTENKEHYEELCVMAAKHQLGDHITFLRSISDVKKVNLLQSCTCLLYTPVGEHFGIVPVEAMYCECPVIAVNSGGPLETIIDGQTGFLVEQTPEAFSSAMEIFIRNPTLAKTMGKKGKEQVLSSFSFETFATKLDLIVSSIS